MDFIEIGPAPTCENCAQVGADDYPERSRRECTVFKRMLARLFPIPSDVNASYVVRSANHDFGTYRECAIKYDSSCPKATEFALNVERYGPEQWDEIARWELTWYERRAVHAAAVREGRRTLADVPPHFNNVEPPAVPPMARFVELVAAYPL